MKNEIVLSEETLLNYDFKIDARGYRPQEVDKLLDIVINDYKAWGRKEKEYLEKIDEQKNEILELKHKLRTANESMQLYKSSEKEVTNVDILRRVSQLEKIIYGNSKNE
ncbi:MAG: DivIVA domain-containing protein [Bacilli bacterium]|nr:DivIVA domain-containing protein [Bacilli bacterium]